jgi:Rad3-related DNA helicase
VVANQDQTDRGIIVIPDNRIVTKPYGRASAQALPKNVRGDYPEMFT